MNIIEFLTADPVWAIEPAAIERMSYQGKQFVGIEPQVRVQIADESSYEPFLRVVDGVAIIPVMGTIVPRVRYDSGYLMSLGRLRADITGAIKDPRVKGIVLEIDSPGGAVTLVSETAHWIREQSKIKNIVAYGAGAVTSGAAWLAAACKSTIVSTTARAGSIGVLAVHADLSKLDERIGIKYTYLTAGKYKAIGNEDEPLSDEARQILEGQLSCLYDVFVSDIALFRGVSVEVVRRDMAEGKIFIGQQAVDVGLADALGSMEIAVKVAAGAIVPEAQKEKKEDNEGPQETSALAWEAKVKNIQKQRKCSKGEAIKEAYQNFPELHKAYIQAFNTEA